MLNDIYNKRIIELAGNIPRLGRLPDPQATATAHSKLCGSTVKVDLKMEGPVVTDFAHDVKACALGQASSSIMASHVVGSTADELRELRETVRKMLKENGTPPQGKWGDIAAAFLIPAGIIFGVLLGLVIVKHTFLLTGRGVRYARARHRSRPSRPAGRGPAAPEPPLERRTRTHTGPRAPG